MDGSLKDPIQPSDASSAKGEVEFELFAKESASLQEAQAILELTPADSDISRYHYERLATAYKKLLKSTNKLVRMSDRNAATLARTTANLNEKNKELEQISSQLAKYLPAQLYRSIFSGVNSGDLQTRRKKLTVFFSDIKDFTSISDQLQPEDLTWLLNDYFSEMTAIALEHGATVDKFIGDAITIFFGDTDSLGVEDDARACVRMALEMQQRMRALRKKWLAMGFEKPFHMRIGINTGYCNVGNFGSEDRISYTIIGSAVNLASRLESNADPDGVLVSYETYALVKDMVLAEAREPLMVKGFARPVDSYAILNLLDQENAGERYLSYEQKGALLSIDIAQVSNGDRAEVIAAAREIIKRLSEE
jgi:class 3 adenylate cyclase